MFIPPGEKILETRKCTISGEEFVVTDRDAQTYDMLSPIIGGVKQSISYPTLCPRERQIRRMSWRNYDNLYQGACALTGKRVISTYRSGTPYKVASLEAWWSDDWEPHSYGVSMGFDRPFFEQFHELDQAIPHMPLSVSKCQNCDFTNFSVQNKNCYLCTRVADCEDCYYCFLIVRCKNCFDCCNCTDTEYCYECIRVTKSYHSLYCMDCENCQECYLLKDCTNCHHCFGSCNLKNAKYIFNNKQLSESDYHAKLAVVLQKSNNFSRIRTDFLHYCEQFPKRYMIGFHNENVTGNYLFDSHSIVGCYEGTDNDNVRHSYGGHRVKDCTDVSFGYIHEKSMEICGGTFLYAQFFSLNNLDGCHDLLYCKDCVNATHDCFGCDSLKKGSNCILNIAYSKHEYEETVTKIIDHMRSTGEWGEFFSTLYSPFAFNESAAFMHFPLEREQVRERGWVWLDADIETNIRGHVPLVIDQYDEKKVGFEIAQKNITELLGATLICEESHKPYQIIKPELAYYITNSLAIPRLHPQVRSMERARQALPNELYERNCTECGQAFFTPYSPSRPERILCEECYRKLVY